MCDNGFPIKDFGNDAVCRSVLLMWRSVMGNQGTDWDERRLIQRCRHPAGEGLRSLNILKSTLNGDIAKNKAGI